MDAIGTDKIIISPDYLTGSKPIRLPEGHIFNNNGSYRVEYFCCGIKAKTKTFKQYEDAVAYRDEMIKARNNFCDTSRMKERTAVQNEEGIIDIINGKIPVDAKQRLNGDMRFYGYCESYINRVLIPTERKKMVDRGLSRNIYSRRISDIMSIVDCHIKDSALGVVPINEITEDDLEIYIKLISKKVMYKTAENIMQVVSQVMAYAANKRHIDFNYANPAAIKEYLLNAYYSDEQAERSGKMTSAYTQNEAEKLINAAKARNYVLGVLIQFLLQTGARKEEALGLKFSDIDFEKNYIHICRSVSRRRNVNPDKANGRKTSVVCEDSLKTVSSDRYIDVDEEIISELKKLREYQVSDMGIIEPVFCFVTAEDKFINPDRVWEFLKAAASDAEIRSLRVHELRHTYATSLYNRTHDMSYVSKQLGHTNLYTTRRYIEKI